MLGPYRRNALIGNQPTLKKPPNMMSGAGAKFGTSAGAALPNNQSTPMGAALPNGTGNDNPAPTPPKPPTPFKPQQTPVNYGLGASGTTPPMQGAAGSGLLPTALIGPPQQPQQTPPRFHPYGDQISEQQYQSLLGLLGLDWFNGGYGW